MNINGHCDQKLANDVACDGHDQCQSGRCEENQDGQADEYCNGYHCYCKPAAENGRHCEIDSNCASGYCKPDAHVCADKS